MIISSVFDDDANTLDLILVPGLIAKMLLRSILSSCN